jgi:hypothetical protein
MSTWRATETRPPERTPISSSSAQRRLFLLATAFVTRGMKPDDAHKTALYYIKGAGRGRTWISALVEQDGGGHCTFDRDRPGA